MRMPKLSDVSSSRGAPMGRSSNITEPDAKMRMNLVRLKWVDGDYDQGGAYWGNVRGTAIYWASGIGEDEVQETFVRATSREDAKNQVRDLFHNATFYR